MTDIQPGDILSDRWVIGDLIGIEERTPCDAPYGATYGPEGQCRCLVCARCHHHTGNSHQGHYWAMCKVTGTDREFHFCCPSAPGCELEATA